MKRILLQDLVDPSPSLSVDVCAIDLSGLARLTSDQVEKFSDRVTGNEDFPVRVLLNAAGRGSFTSSERWFSPCSSGREALGLGILRPLSYESTRDESGETCAVRGVAKRMGSIDSERKNMLHGIPQDRRTFRGCCAQEATTLVFTLERDVYVEDGEEDHQGEPGQPRRKAWYICLWAVEARPVESLIETLMENGRFGEAERICSNAVQCLFASEGETGGAQHLRHYCLEGEIDRREALTENSFEGNQPGSSAMEPNRAAFGGKLRHDCFAAGNRYAQLLRKIRKARWREKGSRPAAQKDDFEVFFSVDPRDPDWLVQEALAYDPFRISERALSNFISVAGPEQRTTEHRSEDEGMEGHFCRRNCASTLSAGCGDSRGRGNLSEGLKEESVAPYNPKRTYVSEEQEQRQSERREAIERTSDVGEESGCANTLGCPGDPLGMAVAEWQTGLERLERILVFALASAKRTSAEQGNKREEHSGAVAATADAGMRHTEVAGRDKGSNEPGQHLEVVKRLGERLDRCRFLSLFAVSSTSSSSSHSCSPAPLLLSTPVFFSSFTVLRSEEATSSFSRLSSPSVSSFRYLSSCPSFSGFEVSSSHSSLVRVLTLSESLSSVLFSECPDARFLLDLCCIYGANCRLDCLVAILQHQQGPSAFQSVSSHWPTILSAIPEVLSPVHYAHLLPVYLVPSPSLPASTVFSSAVSTLPGSRRPAVELPAPHGQVQGRGPREGQESVDLVHDVHASCDPSVSPLVSSSSSSSVLGQRSISSGSALRLVSDTGPHISVSQTRHTSSAGASTPPPLQSPSLTPSCSSALSGHTLSPKTSPSHLLVESDPQRLLGWTLRRLFDIIRRTSLVRSVALPLLQAALSLTLKQRLPRGLRRCNRASRRAALKHAAAAHAAALGRRTQTEKQWQGHTHNTSTGKANEVGGRAVDKQTRERDPGGLRVRKAEERGEKGKEPTVSGPCAAAESTRIDKDRQRRLQQQAPAETVALAAAILALGKTEDKLPSPSSASHLPPLLTNAGGKRSSPSSKPLSESGGECHRARQRELAACLEGGHTFDSNAAHETRSVAVSETSQQSRHKLQPTCPVSSKSSTVSGYSCRRTRQLGEEDLDPWVSEPNRRSTTWDTFLRIPGPPSDHLLSTASEELRRLYSLYVAMVQFLFLEEKEAEVRKKYDAEKNNLTTRSKHSGDAVAESVHEEVESSQDKIPDGRGCFDASGTGSRQEQPNRTLATEEGPNTRDVSVERDAMTSNSTGDESLDFFTFLRLPLLARLRLLAGVDRRGHEVVLRSRARNSEEGARHGCGSRNEAEQRSDDSYRVPAADIVERLRGLLQPQKVFDEFFVDCRCRKERGRSLSGRDRSQEGVTVRTKVRLTCPFGATKVNLSQPRGKSFFLLQTGTSSSDSPSLCSSAYLSGPCAPFTFSSFCSALDEFCSTSATQQIADFCLEALPWSSAVAPFSSLPFTDILYSSPSLHSSDFHHHALSTTACMPGFKYPAEKRASVEIARQCLAVVAEVIQQSSLLDAPSSRLLKRRSVVGEIALCAVYHKASLAPAESLLSVVDHIYNALPQTFEDDGESAGEERGEWGKTHRVTDDGTKDRDGDSLNIAQNVRVAKEGGGTGLPNARRLQRETSSRDEEGLTLMAAVRYRKRIRALAGGADMLEQHLNVVEFLQRLFRRQESAFSSACSVTFAQLEAGCLFPRAARLFLPSLLRCLCSTACHHDRGGRGFAAAGRTRDPKETSAFPTLPSPSPVHKGSGGGISASMFIDHAMYIQRRACAALSPDEFFDILLHTCATELPFIDYPPSSFAADFKSSFLSSVFDEVRFLAQKEADKKVLSGSWKRRALNTRVQEGSVFMSSSGLGVLLKEIVDRWLDVALLSGEVQNGLFLCRVGENVLRSARGLISAAPSLAHPSLDAAQLVLSLFRVLERHPQLRRGGPTTKRVPGEGVVERQGAERRDRNPHSSSGMGASPGCDVQLLSDGEKDMSTKRKVASLSRQVETELLFLSFVKALHGLSVSPSVFNSREKGTNLGKTNTPICIETGLAGSAGNALGAFEALASKAGSSAKAVTARAASAVAGVAREGGARALGALGVSSASSTLRLFRGGVARYGLIEGPAGQSQEKEVRTQTLATSFEIPEETKMHKRMKTLSGAATDERIRVPRCSTSFAQYTSSVSSCSVSSWPETPLEIRLAAGVPGGLSRLLQGILDADPAAADEDCLLEELIQLSDLNLCGEEKAGNKRREEQKFRVREGNQQQSDEKRGEKLLGQRQTTEKQLAEAGANDEVEVSKRRKEQRRRRLVEQVAIGISGRWSVLEARARAYWVSGKRQEALIALATLLVQQQQARYASFRRLGLLGDGQTLSTSSLGGRSPFFSSDAPGRTGKTGNSGFSTSLLYLTLLEMKPSLSVLTLQLTRSPASSAFFASPECPPPSSLESRLTAQLSTSPASAPFLSPNLRGGLLGLTISACSATHLPVLLQAFAVAQHEQHMQSASSCGPQLTDSTLAEEETSCSHRTARTTMNRSQRDPGVEKAGAPRWTKDLDGDDLLNSSERYWWPERGSDWFGDREPTCSTRDANNQTSETVCKDDLEGLERTKMNQMPVGAASAFWETLSCQRRTLDNGVGRKARGLSQRGTETKSAGCFFFSSASVSFAFSVSKSSGVSPLFVRARTALGLGGALSPSLQSDKGRTPIEDGRERRTQNVLDSSIQPPTVPVKPLPVAPAALVFSAIEAAEGVVRCAAFRAKEEYGRRLGGRSAGESAAATNSRKCSEQHTGLDCSPCYPRRASPEIPPGVAALQARRQEKGRVSERENALGETSAEATWTPTMKRKDSQPAFVGPLADTLRAVVASRGEVGAGEGRRDEAWGLPASGRDHLIQSSHLPVSPQQSGPRDTIQQGCEIPQGEEALEGGEHLADFRTETSLPKLFSFLSTRRERRNPSKGEDSNRRRAVVMLAVLKDEESLAARVLKENSLGRQLLAFLFFWPRCRLVIDGEVQISARGFYSRGGLQDSFSASSLSSAFLKKDEFPSSWDLPLSLFERVWVRRQGEGDPEEVAPPGHAGRLRKEQVGHRACRTVCVDDREPDGREQQLTSLDSVFQPLLRVMLTRVDAEAAFLLAALFQVLLPSPVRGGTLLRGRESAPPRKGVVEERGEQRCVVPTQTATYAAERNSIMPLPALLLLRHHLSGPREVPLNTRDMASAAPELNRPHCGSRSAGSASLLKSRFLPGSGVAAAGRASVATGCLSQVLLRWEFVMPSCFLNTPDVRRSEVAEKREEDEGERTTRPVVYVSSCTMLHSLLLVRRFFEACTPLQVAILTDRAIADEREFPVMSKSRLPGNELGASSPYVVARLACDAAFRKQELLRLACSSPHLMDAAAAVLLVGGALQIALSDLPAHPDLLPPSSCSFFSSEDSCRETKGKEKTSRASLDWGKGTAQERSEQRGSAERLERTGHTLDGPVSEVSLSPTCLYGTELTMSEEVSSMRLDAFEKLFLSPAQPLHSFLGELQVQLPLLLHCTVFPGGSAVRTAGSRLRRFETRQIETGEEGAGAPAKPAGDLRRGASVWETGRRIIRLLRVFAKAMVRTREEQRSPSGPPMTLLDRIEMRCGQLDGQGVMCAREEDEEERQVEILVSELRPRRQSLNEAATGVHASGGGRSVGICGARLLREMAEKTLILRTLFGCAARAANCSPSAFLADLLRLNAPHEVNLNKGEGDRVARTEEKKTTREGGSRNRAERAETRSSIQRVSEDSGNNNGDADDAVRKQPEGSDLVRDEQISERLRWVANETGLGIADVDDTLQSLLGYLPLLDITTLFLPPLVAACESKDVVQSASLPGNKIKSEFAGGCESSGPFVEPTADTARQRVTSSSSPESERREKATTVRCLDFRGGEADLFKDPFFCSVVDSLLADDGDQPPVEMNALAVLSTLQRGSELLRRRCPPGLLAEQILVSWLGRQKTNAVSAGSVCDSAFPRERVGEGGPSGEEIVQGFGEKMVDVARTDLGAPERGNVFICLLLHLIPTRRWAKLLEIESVAKRTLPQEENTRNRTLDWQLVVVGCMRHVLSTIFEGSVRPERAEGILHPGDQTGLLSLPYKTGWTRRTKGESAAPAGLCHEDLGDQSFEEGWREVYRTREGQQQHQASFHLDLESFLLKAEARLMLAVACSEMLGGGDPLSVFAHSPPAADLLYRSPAARAVGPGPQSPSPNPLLFSSSPLEAFWLGEEETSLSLGCTQLLAYCDEQKFAASRTSFGVSLCTSVSILVSHRIPPSSVGRLTEDEKVRWAAEKEKLVISLRRHAAAARQASLLSHVGGSNLGRESTTLVTGTEGGAPPNQQRQYCASTLAGEPQLSTVLSSEPSPDEAAASRGVGDCLGAFLALGLRQWLDGLLRRLLNAEKTGSTTGGGERCAEAEEEAKGTGAYFLCERELVLLAHLGHHLQLFLGRMHEVLAGDTSFLWDVRGSLFGKIVEEVGHWVIACCSTTGGDPYTCALVTSSPRGRSLIHFFCLVVCDTLLQHRPLFQRCQGTSGGLAISSVGPYGTSFHHRASLQLEVAVLWLTAQCVHGLLGHAADKSASTGNILEKDVRQNIFFEAAGKQHRHASPSFSDGKAPEPAFSSSPSDSLYSFVSFCTSRCPLQATTTNSGPSEHPVHGTQPDAAVASGNPLNGSDACLSEWRLWVCSLLVTPYCLDLPDSKDSNAPGDADETNDFNSSSLLPSREDEDGGPGDSKTTEKAGARRLLLVVLLLTAKHLRQLGHLGPGKTQSEDAGPWFPRSFLDALSHKVEAEEQGARTEELREDGKSVSKQQGQASDLESESVVGARDNGIVPFRKNTFRRLKRLMEENVSEEEALLVTVLVGRLDPEQAKEKKHDEACTLHPGFRCCPAQGLLILGSLMNSEWLDVLKVEGQDKQTRGDRLGGMLPAILSRFAESGSLSARGTKSGRVGDGFCCSSLSLSSAPPSFVSSHCVAVSQQSAEEWPLLRQRVAEAVRLWWRDVAACVDSSTDGMTADQGTQPHHPGRDQQSLLHSSWVAASWSTAGDRRVKVQMVLGSLAHILPWLRILRPHLLRYYRVLSSSSATSTSLLQYGALLQSTLTLRTARPHIPSLERCHVHSGGGAGSSFREAEPPTFYTVKQTLQTGQDNRGGWVCAIPTTAWLLRIASSSLLKKHESLPDPGGRPAGGDPAQEQAGENDLRVVFGNAREIVTTDEKKRGTSKEARSSVSRTQLNSALGCIDSPQSCEDSLAFSRLTGLYVSLCQLLRETSPLFLAAVYQNAAEEEQEARVDTFYPSACAPGAVRGEEDQHGRVFWRHVTERLGKAVHRVSGLL
ncbi:hypothetical protein CSUI_005628 [Cystoisospora suis]|uniref:Uncharacterized protein n=1 Tax=Cystoisospora suis TaxID=483139 RepID=A0A2C6KWY7_9APIC|nr:hypothetical protein CSUI_005628 [Cystoisospora suis]